MVIADVKIGDVNGDFFLDYVYLIGDKNDISTMYITNLSLAILDGRTGIIQTYPLKLNEGYNPRIFLGDFNDDGVKDILINIDTRCSDGYVYNYLFTYKNNILKELFNADTFHRGLEGDVTYKNYYKVEVNLFNPSKKFILDISDSPLIGSIYAEDGKLLKDVKGQILYLNGLFPIDLNYDSIFELKASQRIIGLASATIGYVNSYWHFKNNELTINYVDVSIIGL